MSPETRKALRDLARSIKKARSAIATDHADEGFADACVLAFTIHEIPQKDGRRLDALADATRLWISTGGLMVSP